MELRSLTEPLLVTGRARGLSQQCPPTSPVLLVERPLPAKVPATSLLTHQSTKELFNVLVAIKINSISAFLVRDIFNSQYSSIGKEFIKYLFYENYLLQYKIQYIAFLSVLSIYCNLYIYNQ